MDIEHLPCGQTMTAEEGQQFLAPNAKPTFGAWRRCWTRGERGQWTNALDSLSF